MSPDLTQKTQNRMKLNKTHSVALI